MISFDEAYIEECNKFLEVNDKITPLQEAKAAMDAWYRVYEENVQLCNQIAWMDASIVYSEMAIERQKKTLDLLKRKAGVSN